MSRPSTFSLQSHRKQDVDAGDSAATTPSVIDLIEIPYSPRFGAASRLHETATPLTARPRTVNVRHEYSSKIRHRRGPAAVLPPALLGAPVRHRAVPAHVARRDGRAWLGFLRHHRGHGRCLCGPSELRHGDHRPALGGAGLPGRHHRTAGLAERGAVCGAGGAEPVFRRHRRQHGFHGQPLHGGPAAAPQRQLHAGRRGRQAARPRRNRLRAALPRGVSRCADRARRHRGIAAAHRPLRLLVRHGAPVDPGRRQGGRSALRQCRAGGGGGGPPARQGGGARWPGPSPASTISAASR